MKNVFLLSSEVFADGILQNYAVLIDFHWLGLIKAHILLALRIRVKPRSSRLKTFFTD